MKSWQTQSVHQQGADHGCFLCSGIPAEPAKSLQVQPYRGGDQSPLVQAKQIELSDFIFRQLPGPPAAQSAASNWAQRHKMKGASLRTSFSRARARRSFMSSTCQFSPDELSSVKALIWIIFNNLSVSHRFSGQWMIENMICTAKAVPRHLHVRGARRSSNLSNPAGYIQLLPGKAGAVEGLLLCFSHCDSKRCRQIKFCFGLR